jgi:CheY-like chemotaxis protein
MPPVVPTGPLVLVVEDDATLREVLVHVLTRAGYRARGAKDGDVALCIMALERPDVVVLDLVMPVQSGWAVRREMLGDPELRDVPVIVATAVVLSERSLGILRVDGALSKPYRHTELFDAIQRALGGAEVAA